MSDEVKRAMDEVWPAAAAYVRSGSAEAARVYIAAIDALVLAAKRDATQQAALRVETIPGEDAAGREWVRRDLAVSAILIALIKEPRHG